MKHSVSLLALGLVVVTASAPAQHRLTFNLGDLLKGGKAVQPQSSPAPALPFELWRPTTGSNDIGYCASQMCYRLSYTHVAAVESADVEPGEQMVETRFDVEVEDGNTGELKRHVSNQMVRCSLQRPLVDGMEITFYEMGQSSADGAHGERYLRICHSFAGDTAEGARRFGYPLIP